MDTPEFINDAPPFELPGGEFETESTFEEPVAFNSEPESVLQYSTFQPENGNIISELTPADFENIVKVLNVIIKEKATDNITIRNSKLRQSTSSCIIEVDMSKILNYNGNLIDLDIVNPKKYVSLFGQFRTENNIFIINDEENNRFIVTNGEISLFLPKQESSVVENGDAINIENAQELCKIDIDKETRKVIKGLSKEQDYIEYLIHENEIKAMHIPDTAIFKFEKYVKDKSASKLDENNAELVLRTDSFLPIDAEMYNISVLKLVDENYSTITTCKIGGIIDVMIIELVNNTSGGNLLI